MQKEENGSKYNKWFIGFLIVFVILLIVLAFSSKSDFKNGNVAVIPINGEIAFGDNKGIVFGSDVVDPDDIMSWIDDAEKSDEIKAVVFEINSPGGSAVASQEIVQKIKQMKKPKFSVIREEGASGAYWIASATDHITANPMSVTGSVGVVASYLEFGGLLEKYNVTYERLVSGDNKDIGSPYRELTRDEKEFFQQTLDQMKQIFLNDVISSRHLTQEQVDQVKTARFFIGLQAKDLNLVDDLGTKADAIKYIEAKINATAELVEYEKPKGFFKSLADSSMQDIGFGIGSALANARVFNEISVRT